MRITETFDVALPSDFEQRCMTICARLMAGESFTVEYLAAQLGVPYEFLITALAVLFGAITRSVPALVDLSPARPLH